MFLGAGVITSGLVVGSVVYGEVEAQTTRMNVKSVEGKTLSSSIVNAQYDNKVEIVSGIQAKFQEASYGFSLSLNYTTFENKVTYQLDKEAEAKERLETSIKFLNDLTNNGTNFESAANLWQLDGWNSFVENIALLKYEDFGESEVQNDLNNAGALIHQSKSHYDQPSFKLLYKLISDLNSGINGKEAKFNVSRAFGDEASNKTVFNYLESKIIKR